MALTGMLVEVTREKVKGLLQERRPDILVSADAAQIALYEARVAGAAVQVILLVGTDPAPGPIRDLAVEAIAWQTGSEIEYAQYPEQQAAGDSGRGYHLHQRYLELLAQLREIINNGGVATTPRPRGRFPAPLGYPDPAFVRGRSGC